MKKIFFVLCFVPLFAFGQFDGRGKFHADTITASHLFGAYDCATYTSPNNYQATSDGFVVAYAETMGGGSTITGYTDGTTPPTDLKAKCGFVVTGAETLDCSIMFPVRNGDYWRIEGATKICWLPLN